MLNFIQTKKTTLFTFTNASYEGMKIGTFMIYSFYEPDTGLVENQYLRPLSKRASHALCRERNLFLVFLSMVLIRIAEVEGFSPCLRPFLSIHIPFF